MSLPETAPRPNSEDAPMTIDGGRSPHTLGQYRRHLATLARWCRDVGHSARVSEITHKDSARFFTSAKGGEKKATPVKWLSTRLKGSRSPAKSRSLPFFRSQSE